jgi:hypothetical protein
MLTLRFSEQTPTSWLLIQSSSTGLFKKASSGGVYIAANLVQESGELIKTGQANRNGEVFVGFLIVKIRLDPDLEDSATGIRYARHEQASLGWCLNEAIY